MPPKGAAVPLPPALDFAGSVAALESKENATVLPAVQFLAAQSTEVYSQLENKKLQEFAAKLPTQMISADQEIRTICLRLSNRLVAVRGPLQQAMLTEPLMQANWSAIRAYGDNFEESQTIMLAQAEAAAAAAADAAAKKGAKGGTPLPGADPEFSLPVPTKLALDAALRYLITATLFDRSSTTTLIESQGPLGSILGSLILMLQHSTLRVQLRACALMQDLVQSPQLLKAALLAGASDALMKLLRSSVYGTIKLAVLHVLMAMCCQPGGQHIQLLRLDVVEYLMQLIMDPETGVVSIPTPPPEVSSDDGAAAAAVTPPSLAAAGAVPVPEGPAKIDFSKPEMSSAAELQMEAVKLLLMMCVRSTGATTRLARLGGMNLLMGMMTMSVAPASRLVTPSMLAQSEVPPPVPGPRMGPLDVAEEGVSMCGHLAAEGDWAACLFTSLFTPPSAKATAPELQSLLLKVVAVMLALPGIQEALWSVKERVSISQLLMFFFIDPPPPSKPATPLPPPPAAKGGKAGPAKGKGKAEEVPPVKVKDPLEPPFSPVVKAAALECLVLMAHHPLLAASLSTESEMWRLVDSASTIQPMMAGILASLLQVMLPQLGKAPPPPPPPPPANPLLPPPPLTDEETPTMKGTIYREDAILAIKELATVVDKDGSKVMRAVVARAALVLADVEVVAKARPPLPSPPPTPPPPPLATSLFVWDALGRPQMADGNAKLVHS